jgi:nucleoporin SEH1
MDDDKTHLNPNPPDYPGDSIQERLDSVNRRLIRPAFLRDISTSRLPSQAASDSSISPAEIPAHALTVLRDRFGPVTSSPLARPVDVEDSTDAETIDIPHQKQRSIESSILEHDFKGPDTSTPPDPTRISALRNSFVKAWTSFEKLRANMQTADKFSTIEHGHQDLVLAVDFNFYGNRMVTASSDHKLKVWDKRDETWTPLDTWRAHDAEVVDVKWNGPFTGSIIGSIGEDGQFKLWEEDVTQAPHSNRRFQPILLLRSETKIPFCSLDFKNLHMETYVALITRDGSLSVLEPVDHDNLAGEWTHMLRKYVCPTPSRQEETGFRVAWHKEKVPCWTAVEAGLDRKALGLAVAAMTTVKIFRTDKERKWYQAAELTGARGVIRDVAWANGSMRGYDVIATASKDGAVRIYEVSTSPDQGSPFTADSSPVTEPAGSSASGARRAMSGIGAGLAGNAATSARERTVDGESSGPGKVKHQVKKVAELMAHGGSVWRVAFSQLGKLHLCYDLGPSNILKATYSYPLVMMGQ